MKQITWDSPNKMHFESELKIFNEQTDILSTGNVWATTQHSGHIRPYTETVNPVGDSVPEGHLQTFDLKPFLERQVPYHIIKEVKQLTHEQQCILYLFKHYSGGLHGHRINDGLLLTTGHTEGYREVKRWYLNQDWRAQNAFEEAIRYVTNSEEEEV